MQAILHIVGYGLLLGVVVPVVLRWADEQRRSDANVEGQDAVLRFPSSHILVLSVALAPFAMLLLYAMAFEPEALPKVGQICAIFLAPGLVLDWYIGTFRIVVGNEGITKRGFGGRVQIAWGDLKVARWHQSLGVLRLRSVDGRSTITVWAMLNGLPTLATRLREGGMEMDEATARQLDGWHRGVQRTD